MGQEEVKNILKKTKDWLLSREIAEMAKLSLSSVQSNLQRMIKWGEIEVRKAREVINDDSRVSRNHPGYAYRLREIEMMEEREKPLKTNLNLRSNVINPKNYGKLTILKQNKGFFKGLRR